MRIVVLIVGLALVAATAYGLFELADWIVENTHAIH